MDYSAEGVYELVGRQDKTAGVTFKRGTEPYDLYGPTVTVQFLYGQREREALDQQVKDPESRTSARLKVRYLSGELTPDQVERLEREEISTDDIAEIIYFRADEKNTFHSTDKRTLNKIVVPIRVQPKGRQGLRLGLWFCPARGG